MDEKFQYTNKSYMEDVNSLEEMEEDVSVRLFREMVQSWLEQNGLKIVLEEVRDRPKPKFRRQNAKANINEQ